MKKRRITSIYIEEQRIFYAHMPKGQQIVLRWGACIQEKDVPEKLQCRLYKCSQYSILRLAKIQEKLAQ